MHSSLKEQIEACETTQLVSRLSLTSFAVELCELAEARIIAQRSPLRIDSQQAR